VLVGVGCSRGDLGSLDEDDLVVFVHTVLVDPVRVEPGVGGQR
jgi:hypothetical protein